MTKLNLNSSAIQMKEDEVYLTSTDPSSGKVQVLILNPMTRRTRQAVILQGSRSFLLKLVDERLYVGLDNRLLMRDSSENWKTVLQSENQSNFFWHMAVSLDGTLYVQEYGEPPTGIYSSRDGENWKLLVTSRDIDSRSRHFHSLAYDCFRDLLIATLGDGNHVRIIVSCDAGANWKPVYRGTWQVLPIVVQKDKIIFGMDSGIARGGLVKWWPSAKKFEILHLKWKGSNAKMQMADLRCLDNGIWIAALGTPQAFVASCDGLKWSPLCFCGLSQLFNHSMTISEGKTIVSFATGKSVILVEKRILKENILAVDPTILEHNALIEKIVGIGHTIKWIWSKQ